LRIQVFVYVQLNQKRLDVVLLETQLRTRFRLQNIVFIKIG